MKSSIYEYTLCRQKVMEFNESSELTTPKKVYAFLQALKLDQKEQETIIVLLIDTANNIKAYYTVSVGLIDSSQAHAREVYRNAIFYGASKIILAHNHPTGNTKPSKNDIKITNKLAEAGKIIDIELLDHIIIGNDFFSFRENNLL